ncbi:MAG: GNAT family N-acetyltransferase [Thermoproteota archaeon]|jgi:Acetyltransferases
MIKIEFIDLKDIEDLSKLAIKFLTEPKVSDNKILHNDINRKYWIELAGNVLARDRRSIMVAKDDGRIVGYIMFNLNASDPFKVKEKWCYVSDIYVLPDYRKKGIGSMLLRAVEELAKKEGIKSIRLIVWRDNEEGIKFYKSLNFKEVGYLMEKDID